MPAAQPLVRSSPPAACSEAEEFEQLMFDWDDAFAADCADAEKAALMARLAEEGHRQHGRGERLGSGGVGAGGCGCLPQAPLQPPLCSSTCRLRSTYAGDRRTHESLAAVLS